MKGFWLPAGGIAGGVVLLTMVAGLYLLYLRRRHQARGTAKDDAAVRAAPVSSRTQALLPDGSQSQPSQSDESGMASSNADGLSALWIDSYTQVHIVSRFATWKRKMG